MVKEPASVPVEVWLRRRRRRAVALWVAAGVVLAAAAGADRAGWLWYRGQDIDPVAVGDYAAYHGKAARVVRVVDGDTIDVALPDGQWSTTRVRLWGVDAPEPGHLTPSGQWVEPEPGSEQALRACAAWAADRVVVLRLRRGQTRGFYGRLLAYVELPDGSVLNERLLREGLVVVEERWPHEHSERYGLLALQAQRDGVGLWGDDE